MMPLNCILRKSTEGYKFAQEKIHHLIYMDEIKLFAKKKKKKKKRVGRNTNNKNIYLGWNLA